ncbi:MAG: hypothetical protein ACXWZE_22415, partial [Candidatus Binatia bacterium]
SGVEWPTAGLGKSRVASVPPSVCCVWCILTAGFAELQRGKMDNGEWWGQGKRKNSKGKN